MNMRLGSRSGMEIKVVVGMGLFLNRDLGDSIL